MNLFTMLITRPMGFIIELIYSLVRNYGLALILFTVLIKLILVPLTVKSQKSMKKQQKLQPAIAELQKKYANDKEKLNVEMMKLYKENNVGMMSGCLPMLIQMPILIGLYQVIQKPLSYMLGVDFNMAESINRVLDIQGRMASQFPDVIGKLAQSPMKDLANMYQIQISKWSEMLFGQGDPWVINFHFFGMDLSNVPTAALNSLVRGDFSNIGVLALLAIPVIAILTTWLVSKLSQPKKNTNADSSEDMSGQMMKGMNLMMPVMTGFFTFTLPSGLGLYWIISNVVQLVQQIILNRHFDRKEDEIDVKIPEKPRKKRKKRK
jgi:YidC/Oxa1 family membrane protein insertase